MEHHRKLPVLPKDCEPIVLTTSPPKTQQHENIYVRIRQQHCTSTSERGDAGIYKDPLDSGTPIRAVSPSVHLLKSGES